MVGDRLWDRQTGQYVLVTAENKRRLPKDSVFVGSMDVGSFVKYYMGEDQLFVIEEMAKGKDKDEFLLIRKTTDPTVVLYVDPKAVTPYRIVEMDEDVDHWFEYY